MKFKGNTKVDEMAHSKCRPRMSARGCLKFWWIIFCVAGFSYHTYMVSRMFFDGSMVSTTDLEFPDRIYPPAFSFCFQWTDILIESLLPVPIRESCYDMTNLINEYTNFSKVWQYEREMKKAKNNCFRHLSSYAKYSDANREKLEEELTANFSSIVKSVSYLHPITYELQTLSTRKELEKLQNQSVESFATTSRPLKCFKVNLFKKCGQGYYERQKMELNDFLIPFFEISFSEKTTKQVESANLFIHRNTSMPAGEEASIVLEANYIYKLAYTISAFEHISDAFNWHSCRNYSEDGLSGSRLRTISKCAVKLTRVSNGTITLGDASKDCQKRYPLPDCSVVTFTPYMTKNERSFDDGLHVGVMLESRITTTTAKPKVSVSEYLTFLTGVIGFWFGFNLLSVVQLVGKAKSTSNAKGEITVPSAPPP